MASLFIGSGSAGSNGLLNFASLAGYNPSLYQYINNNGAYIYTLPWDKKIHNFFLKNNLQGGELEIPQPIYIGLPPILNAGYVSGDIINIYNFTSGSGTTLDAVNQTGSLYITSIAQGVSTLNTTTKAISGRINSSVTLLSGSWNNYVRFEADDLDLLTPTLTDCIKLNPGQKAQFEVVQWGTISGDTSKIPRNSVADDYGYLLDRYGYAQGYIRPGDTTNINTLYGMIYLFRGIENL